MQRKSVVCITKKMKVGTGKVMRYLSVRLKVYILYRIQQAYDLSSFILCAEHGILKWTNGRDQLTPAHQQSAKGLGIN
jgi:hypothetical protein